MKKNETEKAISETAIVKELVDRGQKLFSSKQTLLEFTSDHAANALLNDLAKHPHAFVLACIMDRQVKAETAWMIPHRLSERLGGFGMDHLLAISVKKIRSAMTTPGSLHRFPDIMSKHLRAGIQLINSKYSGDASLIWADSPSSAEVVYRFLEFEGAGPKIASMAANILAREFKVPFSDYYSIDISADVHVKRVFRRLRLIPEGATVEQVIYRARSLHPEFPGLMDYPAWELGRKWCRPKNRKCAECYMLNICPSAPSGSSK